MFWIDLADTSRCNHICLQIRKDSRVACRTCTIRGTEAPQITRRAVFLLTLDRESNSCKTKLKEVGGRQGLHHGSDNKMQTGLDVRPSFNVAVLGNHKLRYCERVVGIQILLFN